MRAVKLTPPQATAVWGRLRWNVGRMLTLDRTHGDLSSYDLVWHAGLAWIIDVPQRVDSRENPDARPPLDRDVAAVRRHCSKFTPLPDPWKLCNHLWDQWRLGRLWPSYRPGAQVARVPLPGVIPFAIDKARAVANLDCDTGRYAVRP